ncbi:hypothetical protein CP533_6547 [Ophiocordyceps camponoti-saundersi (nom. inval.)]|nr:hypothetical protein CP533_6547 [Ophiocordyceps camponoti-saundersi (nom. inval.)]
MGQQESDRHHSVRSWLRHVDAPGQRLSPAMVDDESPWRPHHLLSQDVRPTRRATQSPSLFVRDSPLPSISSSEHHFGKKSRRKTRPDRYDSAKRSPPSNVAEAPSKKRKKDGKRRRLRSDREVMDNFASQAIASDRLTPNLRAGSFLNGRSSVAAQPADLAFYHLSKPDQGSREPRRPSNQSKAARDLQDDADFFANVKKKHIVVIGSDRHDSARGTSVSRPASTSRHTTISQKAVLGHGSISTQPSSINCFSNRAATPVSRRRIPKWNSVEPQSPPVDARQPIYTPKAESTYRDEGVMVDTRRCNYVDKGVMVSPGFDMRPSFSANRSHDGRERRSLNIAGVGDASKPGKGAPMATTQSPSAIRGKSDEHRRVPAKPGIRPSTHDGVGHFAGYHSVDKQQSRTFSESQVPSRNHDKLQPPVQQPRYHATARQPFEASTVPLPQETSRPIPDTTRKRAPFTALRWQEGDLRGGHTSRDGMPRSRWPPREADESPQDLIARLDREAPLSWQEDDLRDGHTSRDEMPRSRWPTREADESPQDLIARLDREAREQFEASSRYDRAYGDGNDPVDRYEVGLQLHELEAGKEGVRGGRFDAPWDPRDGIKPRTPKSVATRQRRWDGAYEVDAVDWTEFWRPNCFG